jgi:hypothetical protein
VPSTFSTWIARLLWFFPGVLLFLTVAQSIDSYQLSRTWTEGTPAVAEIVEYHKRDRTDVTYGHVQLRVVLEDGTPIERLMPLPVSLLPQLEHRSEVAVHVLPDAAKTIVIDAIARPQRRMAAINAMMSFVGFVLLSWGVFSWNRLLATRGDPAYADPAVTPAD